MSVRVPKCSCLMRMARPNIAVILRATTLVVRFTRATIWMFGVCAGCACPSRACLPCSASGVPRSTKPVGRYTMRTAHAVGATLVPACSRLVCQSLSCEHKPGCAAEDRVHRQSDQPESGQGRSTHHFIDGTWSHAAARRFAATDIRADYCRGARVCECVSSAGAD
jgi:hypothetical protein